MSWTPRPADAWRAGLRECALVSLLAGSFWTIKFGTILNVAAITPAAISTLVLVSVLAAIGVLWSRVQERRKPTRSNGVAAALMMAGLAGALVWRLSDWITRLVRFGIDVNRADMLVAIREAVARFSDGLNPYVIYHVPWELPLAYGPWLWMWFLIPHALAADLRFVTVFGQAFVVLLLATAAAVSLSMGAWLRGALLACASLAVMINPMFEDFLLIGHTPGYWPIIALFALALAGRRHLVAAAALGALLGARTTMISLVPVFLIYLWYVDRRQLVPAAAILTAVVAVSFGPFLLLDWQTVVYGLYGNYLRVVNETVWTRTDWMSSTLGLTRVLVANGWSAYAGLAQAGVMAVVYAVIWWRLRADDPVAPWLVTALAAFSMTSLWPVWYLFLDVFVLALLLLAADWSPPLRARPWATVGAVTALTAATMVGTLLVTPGVYYTIQAGQTPRWYLRSGFGEDARDESGGYAWATRDTVYLRAPRGLRTDAVIEVTCAPHEVEGAPKQTMSVRLNGVALGQVALRSGRQTVHFQANSRHWRIGHNDLVLGFSYALPSAGGETRAARIDRVAIRRPG